MTFNEVCIEQTVEAVRRLSPHRARVGIVLGSGLGSFVEGIQIEAQIPYSELPHFPCSTAPGHAGRLILGTIDGTPVCVLQGRCHLYEGYKVEEVTYPIRTLQALGVDTLILSCAAGGLAPGLNVGDLLVIDEQINLQFKVRSQTGGLHRFKRNLYHRETIDLLLRLLNQCEIPGGRGTYLAVSGPTYETRAEQRFLRMFATAVGMSTVAEAAVGNELGMRVCGIATITNLCNPDAPVLTDGNHVVQAAIRAEPRFRQLVKAFLRELNDPSPPQYT